MTTREAVIKIMEIVSSEKAEELLELKKSSMIDLDRAKAEVQSWWMSLKIEEKMKILFEIEQIPHLLLQFHYFDADIRVVLAGILIIRQKDKDYLPN